MYYIWDGSHKNIKIRIRVELNTLHFLLGLSLRAADLPRPVPVQGDGERSQPGSRQGAGHGDLQAGVPHRHGSEDGGRKGSMLYAHATEGQKEEGKWTYPCRLNTRIQAWTLGPRTQRHLRVVREVRKTARENVSKAVLEFIRRTRTDRDWKKLRIEQKQANTFDPQWWKVVVLTLSVALHREQPPCGRRGRTGRSTDTNETASTAEETNK